MEMKLQVGVKIFLQNKTGRYLLIKRSLEKYPNADGHWDIVGGRINPGSSLIENLRREVKEETALEIKSEPILLAVQDIRPNVDKHIVRLSYFGETDGEPVLDLSENIEYKWLTLAEMKHQSDLDSYVKKILDQGLIK